MNSLLNLMDRPLVSSCNSSLLLSQVGIFEVSRIVRVDVPTAVVVLSLEIGGLLQ